MSVATMSTFEPAIESTLRTEIIESQKTQAEFLKWKLISVAALGALALGFNSPPPTGTPTEVPAANARLLMCLVPVICAYTDLISVHLMLRAILIGTYIRKAHELEPQAAFKDYEAFLWDLRRQGNPFYFELFALHGSSVVIAAGIVALGFHWRDSDTATSYAYLVAGFTGAIATLVIIFLSAQRAKHISSMPLR